MNFKVFTGLGLSLTLSPTLVITDLQVAQAQPQIFDDCKKPPCRNVYERSSYGWGRRELTPEEIVAFEKLVQSNKATTVQYLSLGYTYELQGKHALAQERYSTGLEQAKKAGDLKGQAIALQGLGEVFAATGKKQEATSRLTEARNVYIKLGDLQSVTEVNQQLIRLSNQQIQRLNNPSQQIPRPLNLPSERLLNR